MERKRVKIQVQQRIDYANSQDQETFNLETDGELLELRTYSRLTYYDQDDVEITIKWYPHEEADRPFVEIQQPNHHLIFDPSRSTVSRYQTPQGEWLLMILTDSVDLMNSDPRIISINYQIKQGDHLLGDYHFQLKLIP